MTSTVAALASSSAPRCWSRPATSAPVACQPTNPSLGVNRTTASQLSRGAITAPGDVVLVRPGERMPADGEVTEGQTQTDESMLTGEAMPVDKDVGDPLTGGTLNGHGSLVMRATRVGADGAA